MFIRNVRSVSKSIAKLSGHNHAQPSGLSVSFAYPVRSFREKVWKTMIVEERDQMYSSIATKLSNAVAPPKLNAHLSCSLPNGLLTTIPLQCEDTETGNQNTFYLDQVRDKAKAIIRRARKRYYLQVLEADAQTYVNCQLVKDACSLKHGDLIQIGDLFAVYYTEPTVTA